MTPQETEYLHWLDCLKNPNQSVLCMPPLQVVKKGK